METNVKNVNRDIIGVIIVGIVIVTGIYIFTSLADIGGTRGTTEYFSASENSTMNTSSVLISPIEDGVTTFSAQVYNQTWLNFDGVNDRVTFLDSDYLSNNYTYMAWSFWGKPINHTVNEAYLDKYTTTDGREWKIFSSSASSYGQIQVISSENGTTGIASTAMSCGLLYNNWTNVVVIYNGTNFIYYRNGILCGIDYKAIPSKIYNGNANLTLGYSQATGTYYNGSLDSVYILNSSLYPRQIVSLFNEGGYYPELNYVPVLMLHKVSDGGPSYAITSEQLVA